MIPLSKIYIDIYNDTAIHGAGAGAMHNYANYCLQSPRETSVKIFSGGAYIPKNTSYKVKMRKVIVFKAPLHQMIACPCLID